MARTRAFLVSFKNELTESTNDWQREMKIRQDSLEARIVEIENRIIDLSKSIESRHADMWKLIESRHGDMWKLIADMNASLPMLVAMSTNDVLTNVLSEVKADIADARVELSGLLRKNQGNHD
jgi:hypothetical protein